MAERARTIEQGEPGDTKKLQLEFWTAFCTQASSHPQRFNVPKPKPHHVLVTSMGRSGVTLNAVASTYNATEQTYSTHELRSALYLNGPNCKLYYSALLEQRQEIEQEVGEGLLWYNPEDGRHAKIYVQRTVDLNNREQWPEFIHWLLEKLNNMHGTLHGRVNRLDLAGLRAAGGGVE